MATPEQSLVIPFDDNRLLVELVGQHDVHLALIEDRVGVSAVPHGNLITITGTPTRCAVAEDVLKALYNRLESGQSVLPGDVDGAIRHALAPQGDRPSQTISNDNDERRDGRADTGSVAKIKTRLRHITARTPRQSSYITALQERDLVFATGPAGTGKTYLAVAFGASLLERSVVDRLILSRPAVEAGERLGFLPGDMKEKVDPYLRPLYDALHDTLGKERVDRGVESGQIEIAPLAFMRGRTLSDAFVILDEAQNCTTMQMKMFLTRLGENSKMVITGDPTQIDLPPGQSSGLPDAVSRLRGIDDIAVVAFEQTDVVRRELVAKIVAAYERGA